MHRRASAAQHLADRIPSGQDGGETDQPARRYGRRELARSPRVADQGGSRWRLPTLPSLTRSRSTVDPSDETARSADRADAMPPAVATTLPSARSAAARRRRVLTALALATLLTASVVGVAAVAGLPVPEWVVAVPGGLMVAYLVLLAVVRPGSRTAGTAQPVVQRPTVVTASVAADEDEATVEVEPPLVLETSTALPAAEDAVAPAAADSTWTPVPLPTPTYVTAPRARSVRTIDLSNPGSWTAAPAASAPASRSVPAGEGDDQGGEHRDDYLVEHRRAVGD
jgi:hypothetical protein